MNLFEQIHSYGERTETALHAYLSAFKAYPLLKESMAYSVFAGGKRIRPALCLASAELIQPGGAEKALPASCALELIHTYSLIHDDLPAMDNDDFRRGKPSNHKAFGEANAILAGDGLLTFAFTILGRDASNAVLSIIADGAMDMVCGQSLDCNHAIYQPTLEQLQGLKTGALIRAAVLSGACSVGASEADIAALRDFSEHYGLLFQITDDILDATGDADLVGKTLGKDEAEEKLTFVTCYGLEAAKDRADTEQRLAKESLRRFGDRAAFFHELIRYTRERNK